MLTRMPHVLIAWDWQGRRAVRVTRQIRVRPMAVSAPIQLCGGSLAMGRVQSRQDV